MRPNFVSFRTVLLLSTLLCAPMTADAATIVVNGGFETGDLSGWSCTGADFCDADSASPRSGVFHMRGYDNFGFATLSQDLSTTAGDFYSFEFSSFADYSLSGNVLRYQIGSGPIVTVPTTLAYALTSTSFQAVSGLTTLSFYFETDSGTGTWRIDDVLVEARATAPEPAMLSLLGLGLAGLAARRRSLGQRS